MKTALRCQKCQGIVVNGYDVGVREEYQYCVNCGFRPQWAGRFPDGVLTNVPAMCRRCKQHPCVSVTYPNKGIVWTELCQHCRVEYLARRREQKRVQREAEYV